jgi:hypothetical protein
LSIIDIWNSNFLILQPSFRKGGIFIDRGWCLHHEKLSGEKEVIMEYRSFGRNSFENRRRKL